VLAPSNLLKQWVDEIQKFTGGHGADGAAAGLKVLEIGTATQLKALTVDKISKA
ncbi:unnamed protein product, partial [Symbiodinium pilosum]